jgi:hypothetical protein
MVVGSRSVHGLLPLLDQLPPLSDHPNRELRTREVFVAHLLAFFNPTLHSLRTLEDFSRTSQARRYLAVDRLPKITLADFHRLVDPAVLEPILSLAADVAWAVRHATAAGEPKAGIRIDVHLDVASGLPRVVNVHGAGTSEPA